MKYIIQRQAIGTYEVVAVGNPDWNKFLTDELPLTGAELKSTFDTVSTGLSDSSGSLRPSQSRPSQSDVFSPLCNII